MNVTIRPITYNDTDNIVRWRNSDFVSKRFLYRAQFTPESHNNWMETMVETKKVYQFIINCDGADVGSIYLRDVDLINKKAEYGVFIGEKDYLGKGVGQAATKLILDFAFTQLKLHKVFLRVLSDNIGAIKSYEKSGFVQEGFFKDEIFADGKYESVIFMAVFNMEDL
ncbi:MAG: UDP-4-amino-4,6-dideoxy-N-acetyl-beta-L-altrosamine N-acetyltransferase [Ruminococcaceae bacterium]|nr:UDP-4-amino-4,6-dideoxy-N-acetyl-beta-L-altrosamine N-acetyltransferase [Oscillospiraceae bacterium]